MILTTCESCKAAFYYMGAGTVECPNCHKIQSYQGETPEPERVVPEKESFIPVNYRRVRWISATGIAMEEEVSVNVDLEEMIGKTFKKDGRRYKIKEYEVKINIP